MDTQSLVLCVLYVFNVATTHSMTSIFQLCVLLLVPLLTNGLHHHNENRGSFRGKISPLIENIRESMRLRLTALKESLHKRTSVPLPEKTAKTFWEQVCDFFA